MKIRQALESGVVGACALTLLHEAARRVLPNAPRLDILGMRALSHALPGGKQPAPARLHTYALVGDLIANTLYYSLVSAGKRKSSRVRGALLGGAAGLGAVVLPPLLGLGQRPSARTPATRAMTVGWYVIGGLAAAGAWRRFSSTADKVARGGIRIEHSVPGSRRGA
jgi:hypothetical protein